jgi:hypothetical protein
MAVRGGPRAEGASRWVVIWSVQGPHSNSQMGYSTIQDTQYNIKHAGIQGYENTRIQNEKTQDTRIQGRTRITNLMQSGEIA